MLSVIGVRLWMTKRNTKVTPHINSLMSHSSAWQHFIIIITTTMYNSLESCPHVHFHRCWKVITERFKACVVDVLNTGYRVHPDRAFLVLEMCEDSENLIKAAGQDALLHYNVFVIRYRSVWLTTWPEMMETIINIVLYIVYTLCMHT